jgi:ribosomal protein L7/L12
MRKNLIELLECIQRANSLDVAKAYAEAAIIFAKGKLPARFSVELKPGLPNTNYPFINVIKEVRSIFGLSLKDSKDLVEQGHMWTNLNRAQAVDVVDKLRAQGATASVLME